MDSLRYTHYKLPCGRDVFLTQRPDRAEPQSVVDFIEAELPAVRFCFTDDFVDPSELPGEHVDHHWLPWLPGCPIPIENVFAFISMMEHYVKKGTIWLHCDSSTMRAPTYFGLYLYAMHLEGVVQEIVDKKETSEGFDKVYAEFSCAKKYADICFSLQPEIKSLVATWQGYGEVAAHVLLMKYRREK